MKYYVSERRFDEIDSVTARAKARDDAESIVRENGYMPIVFDVPDRSSYGYLRKIWWQFRIIPVWKKYLKQVTRGDELFLQFPFREHSIFLPGVIKKTHKRGVKVVLLVHDLDVFRNLKSDDRNFFDKVKCKFEVKALKYASRVILHNEKMIKAGKDMGLEEVRLKNLKLFDYLVADDKGDTAKRGLDLPLVIAGNLSKNKAGYVYDLPKGLKFNLYGPRYEGRNDNEIKAVGSFPPEELPFKIEGSFGIVWDGSSSKTCEGIHGKYLKINNPHKTSLYLASGLPVIIWKEAALADLILENGCGFAVDSLDEIKGRLAMLSDSDYEKMRENACKLGAKLKEGYFLKSVLKE